MQQVQSQQLCVASGYIPPTYVQFGNIKIHCKTGEVEGLSENITEDAKFFWEQVKEHIISDRRI